ncbi:MAG: AAA family ATPase [Methanoregula sp.]|jgi:replication factor C small subunit
MLWIEKYRPQKLSDIIGQDAVIHRLTSFAASGVVPHLILSGPHGTGKSAAIECLAKALYKENWELNTSFFQTADLFSQGKVYLEQDDRYTHLYQKNQSLITNFKYIIKWYASLRPLDAEFKLMVFEDAHTLTRDAQQALRRIMERASGTCRFILSTTNQSAIIPPIASRCLPLSFSTVDQDVMLTRLRTIRERENSCLHPCSDDDLDLIAQVARGDMRRAILLLQVALEAGRCRDLSSLAQSETTNVAASAVDALRKGDVRTAIRRLESLVIDYGLSGGEVFLAMRTIMQREYNHPALAIALADAEYRLQHGNNEFIQIGAFASGIQEVFT